MMDDEMSFAAADFAGKFSCHSLCLRVVCGRSSVCLPVESNLMLSPILYCALL